MKSLVLLLCWYGYAALAGGAPASNEAAVAGSSVWTLDRALQHALSNNPDAQIARARISAARAGLDQANAAFWPRLQFQSSYVRTDNPMQVFGSILNQRAFETLNFNDVPDVDNLNAKGMITMPLYAGGRNVAGRSAARAEAEAAEKDDEAVRNALGFEVTRAFHSIHKTRAFVRAAEAAVRSLEESVGVANKRLDAGALLKTDVLDLEVRLAEAREDLVRARNSNVLAERVLLNLLGMEAGDSEFRVSDDSPTQAVPESQDYSRRAELSAAMRRERAASERVRAAKGGHLPSVSAFGSLDYDYGFKYDQEGTSYTVGALLSWDLWDGRSTRAKVREARANLASMEAESRKTRLAIDLEVEQARLALKSATERLVVTERAEAQAAESLGMIRSRFVQGLALSSQLIDAEASLLAARVRRAEALADQRIAVAALRKALGLPLQEGTQVSTK